jgi:hypothetical protein
MPMTHDLDDPALAHRHGFSIAQGALNFGIAAVVRRPS